MSVMAKVGDRISEPVPTSGLPIGWIQMHEPNPSTDYIALSDGTWEFSPSKERLRHLRYLAYKKYVDPLICEYMYLSIQNKEKDKSALFMSIEQERTRIREMYPYD